MVWKKYKNHSANSGYDNDGMRREDSCDAVKSSSFMQSAEEVIRAFRFYIVLKRVSSSAPPRIRATTRKNTTTGKRAVRVGKLDGHVHSAVKETRARN